MRIKIINKEFEDLRKGDVAIIEHEICIVYAKGRTSLHDHKYIKVLRNSYDGYDIMKYYEHECKGKIQVIMVKK